MPYDQPFELTAEDSFLLEVGRLERFRFLAKLPDCCIAHLDLNCNLSLMCDSPYRAAPLLESIEELKETAFFVLGTQSLTLYGADQALWSGGTRTVFNWEVESEAIGFDFEENNMVAATIDREAIAQTTREEIGTTVNAQIDDVIREEFGRVLDEPALQQRVKERLALFTGKIAPSDNGTVAVIEAPAKPKPLKLPSQAKLEKMVTNRYPTVLNQLILTAERDRYLEAITTETPEGKAWMMKIAAAIFKKYQKPDESAIYGYLLSNARKLGQTT